MARRGPAQCTADSACQADPTHTGTGRCYYHQKIAERLLEPERKKR